MTREEVLVPWLKEQGLYEQFMHNMQVQRYSYPETIKAFWAAKSTYRDVQSAITWVETTEGFKFWSDVQDRWEEYYNSICPEE